LLPPAVVATVIVNSLTIGRRSIRRRIWSPLEQKAKADGNGIMAIVECQKQNEIRLLQQNENYDTKMLFAQKMIFGMNSFWLLTSDWSLAMKDLMRLPSFGRRHMIKNLAVLIVSVLTG
jgi:hypothetical protein